jgi:hypothetical protein
MNKTIDKQTAGYQDYGAMWEAREEALNQEQPGMMPAEIRNAGQSAFMAKLQDPAIRNAALQAVKGMAILQDHNLAITDWAAIGGRVSEIEVEDDLAFEKGWIKFEA